MSPSPQLAPPGSSTYNSDTMYVGDGTWDSSRNTFLLPNLVGLNFATMQYNGMRNRFLDMPGYHNLIKGHGIVAAITFLGIIPAAIFIASFLHRDARLALRLHIWLQILAVLLSTVVFVLGWFAVGSARSLTNPHHGIGLAIYVMILVQAIGGSWAHHREKGKERLRLPLKIYLHQWLGRAIALLGFTQVALGLTVYGSPKVLFILYAIWGFFLLVLYLVLGFRKRSRIGYYDDDSSYYTGYTGTQTEMTEDRRSRRRGHGLGALAAAGAAGAGLAALRHRSRSRRRSRSRTQTEVLSSRHDSRSPRRSTSVDREKYGDSRPKEHTWRNRLLGVGAGVGAIAAVRSLFNRKKHQENASDTSDVSRYAPPVAGSYRRPAAGASTVTQTDISRVEEGLAPESPENNRNRRNGNHSAVPLASAAAAATTIGGTSLGSPSRRTSLRSRRRSGASLDSYSDDYSDDHDRPAEDYTLIKGIAALGVGGFLKHKWDKRRRQKEDARVNAVRAEELERERIARMNSTKRRYTGDGKPGPRRYGGRTGSITDSTDLSTLTASTPAPPRFDRTRPSQPSQSTLPPPQQQTIASQSNITAQTPVPVAPSATFVPPPGHESGSEEYFSAGGRPHRRHHQQPGASSAVPVATVAAAGAGALSPPRDTSRQRSSGGVSMSPPVSVKVKMHEDGRHVTLRRLNEEEAALERERRRKERQGKSRIGSVSSLSNNDDERWRRVAATEAAQAQQQAQIESPATQVTHIPPPPASHMPVPYPLPGPPPGPPPAGPSQPVAMSSYTNLPPPPPMPGATTSNLGNSAMGSSPAGTGTEMSRTSNYDNNRRRRRAERAREKAEKGGSRVEFT